MSVEAIASQLGYDEPASFSRAFKRWYGMSPRSMRQDILHGALPDEVVIRSAGSDGSKSLSRPIGGTPMRSSAPRQVTDKSWG
jgi:AraC-like DNA-binding protein